MTRRVWDQASGPVEARCVQAAQPRTARAQRIPHQAFARNCALLLGWGVADSAVGWSRATGRSWSHLWSTAATPFGPLSLARELSFVQRDAMARNLVLSALNSSVSHAASLLEGVAHIVGLEASPKAILMPQQVRGLGVAQRQERAGHGRAAAPWAWCATKHITLSPSRQAAGCCCHAAAIL